MRAIFVSAAMAVLVGCGGGGGTPDGGGGGGGGGSGGTGGGSGGAASAVTTRYQVTVDQTPLQTLPASCWVSGAPPTPPPATRVLPQPWDLITAGPESFIHIQGVTSLPVGDAEPVILAGILTGADGGFPEQRQVDRTLPNPAAPNPNFSDTSNKSVQIVITSFANGLTGTLKLRSDYTCTSCTNNNGQVSCAVDLPFTASVVPTVPPPEPSTGSSWRLALEPNPLENLPPSCFINNTVPTVKMELWNRRELMRVDLWSAGDWPLLDPETGSINLGHAEPIVLGRSIRGDAGVRYSGTRVERTLPNPAAPNPNFSDTLVTNATFTFESGGTIRRGTLALRSDYTCTSCQNNGGRVNCAVQLPFIAIKGGVPLLSAPPALGGRNYRVAVDDSAATALPPSCYVNNTIPSYRVEHTDLYAEATFQIQSAGATSSLAITPSQYQLGDSEPVIFPTLRGVDAGLFREERVVSVDAGTFTSLERTSLAVNLVNQADLTSGTLDIASSYSCTGCTNNNNITSCSAQLQFKAGLR